MVERDKLGKLTGEFETGIALEKCRECGCMRGALEEILDSLEAETAGDAVELKAKVKSWLGKADESLYT
jgi:hypothetical protein